MGSGGTGSAYHLMVAMVSPAFQYGLAGCSAAKHEAVDQWRWAREGPWLSIVRRRESEVPTSDLELLAHVGRDMLYSFVWAIPAEVLAQRMHVSVESICISCANRGIPMPGVGYWSKVAAGMRPERPPLSSHRPGPGGVIGTTEDALRRGPATEAEDPVAVIDETLGEGTFDLIREACRGIVIDPDAELRPHLRWQRDVCRSEASLNEWLESNSPPWGCLWSFASPGSVARICAILEAMGRAAERLGGTFDDRGFDLFGERVRVSFSEHLGKYRKGQTPSRTYNGLLSLYVGCNVYKDFRKKTLEERVPAAFADVCVTAAYLAKDRRDALEALVGAKVRYAERQASIAAENERHKAFNQEADRYEEALRRAEAHDRAEKLRRYAAALMDRGEADEAAWVYGKADWADPVTNATDRVFGDEHTADGSAPTRLDPIPYDTQGPGAEGFFGRPVCNPSPTLEAFEEIRRQARGECP